MLSSFPAPYPDELLYSMLARYHIRHGNIVVKDTLREVFGNSKLATAYEFPCSIDRLVSNLPMYYGHTAEDLIQNNTLFPFYTVFLPENRTKLIRDSMKNDMGKDVHLICGITASRISSPQYFRFCPLCNQEDLASYGEFYWHRLYQLPGIEVCIKHGIRLAESTIPTHNIHDFVAANAFNCHYSSTNNQETSDVEYRLNCEFSKEVIWLLESYQRVHRLNNIRDRYLTELIKNGFATPTGRVFQRELVQSFITYYGHNYLRQLQSDIDTDSKDSWLTCIVRKHRKTFHPISHILMIRFLSGKIENFINNEISYHPFGEAAWPCLNIAAEHYKESVIKEIRISYSSDSKKVIGTFCCSCGFVYTRTGPDQSAEDRFRFDKVKAYGTEWEKKLEAYSIQQLGLRATARRLKVDPMTIKRYMATLALKTPNVENNYERLKHPPAKYYEDVRTHYRNKWMKLFLLNSTKTKTELRNMSEVLYIWLYRNDLGWLNAIKYHENANVNKSERIDWVKRDKELYKLVDNAIQELRALKGKPVRITISVVGKRINRKTLLEKHLEKLPATKEYLQNNIEGIDKYHQRKVAWAINKLLQEKQDLVKWRIIRAAGIKNYKTAEIDRIISHEMGIFK